jgi:hypothetical protein
LDCLDQEKGGRERERERERMLQEVRQALTRSNEYQIPEALTYGQSPLLKNWEDRIVCNEAHHHYNPLLVE